MKGQEPKYDKILLDTLTKELIEERKQIKDGTLQRDTASLLNDNARNIINVQVAALGERNIVLQKEKIEMRIKEANLKERELDLIEKGVSISQRKQFIEELKAKGATKAQIKKALNQNEAAA